MILAIHGETTTATAISTPNAPTQDRQVGPAYLGANIMNALVFMTVRDNCDLKRVEIIPSYAMRCWTSPSLHPQTIVFRTDSDAPVSRALIFQQNKDLFEFSGGNYGLQNKPRRSLPHPNQIYCEVQGGKAFAALIMGGAPTDRRYRGLNDGSISKIHKRNEKGVAEFLYQ
ncbi:hypothetical protein BDZ45DRAFT_692391 [Acephala macrosclerotiorum]|nr:hypothetical protein BDZ45DRAFT_692391 [Acephala macrosclerotiorum]